VDGISHGTQVKSNGKATTNDQQQQQHRNMNHFTGLKLSHHYHHHHHHHHHHMSLMKWKSFSILLAFKLVAAIEATHLSGKFALDGFTL